ncbi:MAG: helix-turn-helix domain-containing protein [Deltaproteobacteria bacterium]|nr:helix-turn-helix domain-containing protein [Deltaproteobacteria bacterium]
MTHETSFESEGVAVRGEGAARERDFAERDDGDGLVRPDEPPPVATVAEIARFLRVRPNLVYAMYRRGEIPGGQRLGRTIRFSTGVVVEWLKSGEQRRTRRGH